MAAGIKIPHKPHIIIGYLRTEADRNNNGDNIIS